MIRKQMMLTVCVALNSLAPQMALAKVSLSPQNVVDRILQKNPDARLAEYNAQASFAKYSQSLGVYDFKLAASVKWTKDRAQSFPASDIDNIEDKTVNYSLGVVKKFSTGTSVDLKYEENQLDSRLSTAASTAGRFPRYATNIFGLELRQSLLKDVFGYASRLEIEVNQADVENAKSSREENIEQVLLDSMSSYWDTFSAQETLKYALQTREKYQNLVNSTRSKARYNLNEPGQLSRLEAELEQADQKVKQASFTYLNLTEILLKKLKYPIEEEIEFVIENRIPPLPKLESKNIETLRPMKISKTKLDQAQKNVSKVQNQNLPQVDLVGGVKSVGVDRNRSDSFSEMTAGNHPIYYVGFELSYPLDSELQRGNLAEAKVNRQIAEANLEKQTDDLTVLVSEVEKNATLRYQLATSGRDLVELRSKVVKEMESAYRQGRQPLVELIRAYNDLITAQQEYAKSMGQYHIALNKWAATRDELVKNTKGVEK